MSVERQLLMGAAGTATVVSDPYFKQTTLLLHADGTNGAQNNTFIDSSTNNFTITRNGNTTQGTFTPFSQAAGYWGNYFNGSSDYLTTSVGLINTSTDFTIEAWVYSTAWSNVGAIYNSAESGGNEYLAIRTSGTQLEYHTTGTGGSVTYSYTFALNTWYHIAITRASGNLRCFINGSQVGSTASNTTSAITNATLKVGAYTPASSYFAGYISNLRFVIGTAVYTSAFTPSTTPLTAITNTSLLTCQSNRFVDNSANNFTLTPSGTPAIQPFSPFAPTAAYSTTVNGGSGYFDGSGDYLTIPDSAALEAGSSNWTVEGWFYVNSLASNQDIFGRDNNVGADFLLRIQTTGALGVYLSSNGTSFVINDSTVITGAQIFPNAWNHFAVSSSGGTIRKGVNGIMVSIGTLSSVYNSTKTWFVGARGDSTAFVNGYISNLRFVIGSAVYAASTYTVPTAPLTAITNTQLLLSCTNAGIYDNAIKNDLETVGNAQISTSVKKYGTGSLYLDGTGDYLVAANSQGFNFGTGDFTVEMWVYVIANQANATLIDTTSGGGGITGWFLEYSATRGMYFYIGNSTSISYGTTPTLSTWTHLAVARSSGTCKLFINGTQVASSSLTTSANSAYPMYVGGVSPGGLVPFYGYIDDLRITKGVARYTANFTPPTSAFPNQ